MGVLLLVIGLISSLLGLLLVVLIPLLLVVRLLALVVGRVENFSALRWCSVLQERWILLHYAIRASFSVGRWSATVCLPVRFSVLWPAAWVSCVDKSRGSKSVEIRRIWEVCDESLSFVRPTFWRGIRSSLLAGDVLGAQNLIFFSSLNCVTISLDTSSKKKQFFGPSRSPLRLLFFFSPPFFFPPFSFSFSFSWIVLLFFLFLFLKYFFTCFSFLAFVSGFNKRCFLRKSVLRGDVVS